MIASFFRKKIIIKNCPPFTADNLKETIVDNRKALKRISNWVDDKAFENSFFKYGVPDFIKKDINKEIDNTPTYTDYIIQVAKTKFDSINYLEIGVSVCKNFFQIVNAVENGNFTGFDIEELNPIVGKEFSLKKRVEWPTISGSIKTKNSSLSAFDYKKKTINYISADVWDSNSWSKLSGNKYNIIFSDALHSPEAILYEFEMLVKYKLLADKFVIVWDDLVGEMQTSFFNIINKYNRNFKIKEAFLFKVNGWVGQYEEPHTVGLISNFNIAS